MRGSKLSRAIQYFEEADYREARVAFTIVKEVMDTRARQAHSKTGVVKRIFTRRKKAEPPVEAVAADAS